MGVMHRFWYYLPYLFQNLGLQGHSAPKSCALSVRVTKCLINIVRPCHLFTPLSAMDELLKDLATLHVEESERDTPEFWSDLGLKLFAEFKGENCGHQCCIDNTVAAYAKAVERADGQNPKYSTYLRDLADALRYRHLAFWDLQDLDRSILLYQKIIDLSNPNEDSDSYIKDLHILYIFQESRFRQTQGKGDIMDAIATLRRVVDLNPGEPEYMNDLANASISLFDLSNDINKVEEGIMLLRRALEIAPEKSTYLSNLSISLRLRFEYSGELEDIEEAITFQRKAIINAEVEDPVLYNKLNNLAIILASRYNHFGDFRDLEESITIQERAVNLLTDDHPSVPMLLYNLGTKFRSKYLRTGELQDIQRGAYLLQKSMSLFHPQNPELPMVMSDLGNILGNRFDHSGDMNDLNEAIEMQMKALGLLPIGHSDVARMLTNLGGRLICRFNNTDDTRDLEEAINVNRAAVRNTPEKHPFIAGRLTNLASALDNLYLVTGDPGAIEEAVDVQKNAIQLTSESHPGMPNYLNFLAGFLQSRFKDSGDVADLLEARDVMEKAINLTPDDHPSKPSYLNHFGSILEIVHGCTNDFDCMSNANTQYKLAATMGIGQESVCLRAARNWARVSQQLGFPVEVMTAYSCAFDILPRVAWLGYTIAHRHSQLKMISQLANEACAAALSLGEVIKAVEWLEQGRGIVWSQLNQLRTPLEDLEGMAPDLAKSLAEISAKLEKAGSASKSDIPSTDVSGKLILQEEAQNQQEMARKRESLLEEIRKLAGFEDFLKPLPFSRLKAGIPEEGHVVLINVHYSRCDAIILCKNREKPIHIHLSDLSFDQVLDLQSNLRISIFTEEKSRSREERSGRVANWEHTGLHWKDVREILTVLWESVTKPILESIELSPVIKLEIPTRLWWCPTGPLAFLPLHAAGLYVTALVEKTTKQHDQGDFHGIMAVSVPNAPELPPIPNTTLECQWIKDHFAENGLRVTSADQEEATVSKVLEAMDTHHWIHLACHASQNLQEPTKSAFYLHDGELNLLDIMRKKLPNAELAFLSACQTSAGTDALSEEAVHLAAGMLMAGYRSVIATLWSIEDEVAMIVSRKIYEYLLRDLSDGGVPDSLKAAEALHYAVRGLQDQLPDTNGSLLSWIPFVHMGL
ncbi:CHAT domain-containing protein [Cyathus striatus]|nr:CHAT domain-containing protein [Cyathus striatus]